MFHCTLDQVYYIKHFEIVAKKELLFPTLFPTGKFFFKAVHPKIFCGAQTVVH